MSKKKKLSKVELNKISLEDALNNEDAIILDNQHTNQTLIDDNASFHIDLLENNLSQSIFEIPKIDVFENEKQFADKVVKKSKRAIKEEKREERKAKMRAEALQKNFFKYKRNKFKKPKDFITFLNNQYLSIDKIGDNLLDSKSFYGWLKNNCNDYNKSLKSWEQKVKLIEDQESKNILKKQLVKEEKDEEK